MEKALEGKIFKVPSALMEKVVGYLGTRPYFEVSYLISELAKLEPLDDVKPESDTKKDKN